MIPRIVHCATTHRAGDPRIFWKECRTLAEAGYDVSYVVPHGRDEVVHGVRILAVPVPRTGRERVTQTTRHVYRKALEAGGDSVLHLHDSDLLPHGFALKVRGRRVVYDAHEDTPKQMRYQHWIPDAIKPLASAGAASVEVLAGRVFDGIIAAEPENARRFPPAKTELVRNFPIVDELSGTAPVPYDERPLSALYLGSITAVRGLQQMLSTATELRASLGAEIILAGPFYPAELRDEVSGAPGIRVTGYVERSAVPALMHQARVGLVILHPEPKYVESYPTKLFEYMAAGLPVVASDFPVWRRMVEESGAGLLVDPLDQSAVTAAVRWLLENPSEAERMGERGRQAVRHRFDWKGEAEKLIAFYERLIGSPSRTPS